jgi:hypothetical protein
MMTDGMDTDSSQHTSCTHQLWGLGCSEMSAAPDGHSSPMAHLRCGTSSCRTLAPPHVYPCASARHPPPTVWTPAAAAAAAARQQCERGGEVRGECIQKPGVWF